MSRSSRRYEIVWLDEGAKRRAAERAAEPAASRAAAAAAAPKRGRGRPPGQAAERKRREKREALATSFAAGTPTGRRLAERERERDVGSPADLGGIAADARPRAAVDPDGAVPAGFVLVGRELVRIGRDDTKGYAGQRVMSPSFMLHRRRES